MTVVEHALLGLAVAALVAAGLRVASVCVARGLERILATVTFAAAFAVAEAMALGTVKLGADPVPLSGAALVTWLTALRLTPAPAVAVSDELKAWLREAPRPALAATAGVSALLMTWIAWSLNAPYLGVDAIYYHLPQMIRWIHSGSPGAIDEIHYWLWVGDYPLVNGILQTWGMGISQSMVVVSLWPAASMAILITAGWVGLRAAGVGVRLRTLAIAAVVTVPVAVGGLVGPLNDVPALAWLACGAALFAAARENPKLAAPGVVALGLAAGTKTTVLPLALVTLVLGLAVLRPALRMVGRPMMLAGALALLVGGFWYLRDLVNHGSPFWPWGVAPWGDSKPQVLERYGSLLEYPRQTLEGRLDTYASFLSGSVILLPAGFLLAFASGSRWIRFAGVGVLALVFIWASAPSTAKTTGPVFDGSVSQTRYLMPTMALAALAIALVGREGRRKELLCAGVLGSVILWNLGEVLTGPVPAPSNANKAFGLVAGIALGLAVAGPLRSRFALPKRHVAAAFTVVLFALLSIPAAGWVERHGDDPSNFDVGLVRFLAPRADFRDGEHAIYMAPLMAGTLSGDRLQHDVVLISASTPCRDVERLWERGWVILGESPILRRDPDVRYTVGDCLRGHPALAEIEGFRVYPPRSDTGE